MTKAVDLDLSLKLRLRRLFYSQGYWSPIEVELSNYELLGVGSKAKRRSLTDLDVLGVKFDPLFTQHRVVADCKSGRNVSDANRLFWLRGVTSYFGADQGYFVRSLMDSHFRAIAPKMGLRAMSSDELSKLETVAGAANFPIPLHDTTLYLGIRDLWGVQVANGGKISPEEIRLKNVYSYLSYNYWYLESYRNLLSLISHFEGIADLLHANNDRHVLLAYTGAARFGHCLLEVAQYVLSMGAANVPHYAKMYIYGGPLGLKEKEQFFQLLKQATGFAEQLDPDWLPDVLELLVRFLNHPRAACEVLRYLDFVFMWVVQLKNPSLPPISTAADDTAALVLAKDTASTFARAAGIPEQLFRHIKAL